ncbi:hypothetical protein B0H17DRAFT_1218940 [Mycena rosella]|uniref:Uncharacterized protein n=1 Tax=Mycena rosella TaxID=1033263 RepID=A0AAD7BL74_MYCRO|nr:hypothetical protein B0H17DRAFT_1218940 [Mycena rosella]
MDELRNIWAAHKTLCGDGVSIHLQPAGENSDHHVVHNGHLVSRETAVPDVEARQALRAYRDVYDTYFMKQGNMYRVHNKHAMAALQAAEQAWHNWVLIYQAARSMPGRPGWALQPLPGLQSIHCTPAPARRAQLAFPTPPPSSPVRVGSRLLPIDLTSNVGQHLPKKRKFLGSVDISDDEDDALHPPKNARYGTDDHTLWPQQWTARYCHLSVIAKKGSRADIDVMWWDPSPADFIVGSAVTRGLGWLQHRHISQFLPPINDLIERCKELRRTSPTPISPLFGELINNILMWTEQLQTLPSTYIKMVFAVTSLQRVP